MGLKYVEPIKSIILILLVLLSVTFTFTIWTFTPKYETMEQLQTVDISIQEKRNIEEIVKPYKIIAVMEDQLRGSISPSKIETILSEMSNWHVDSLKLAQKDLSKFDIAQILRQPNQMTLYFPGEVPLLVYDNVLLIDENNIPESTFNRLVIDWSLSEELPVVHFLSEMSGMHYTAQVKLPNHASFLRNVVDVGNSFDEYAEIDRGNAPFLAVPKDPVKIVRNTYYQEEISPNRFRDALFSDPNAVRRSQVNQNREEYGDDHALMNVNTKTKMLNFVVPASESQEIAIPSELLVNTIDFINEHGGWTDDFRFSYMNPISRYVKFQLYVQGLPVYSDSAGTTEIAQIWGDTRIFRYIRPYYTLDVNLPSETEDETLPSGVEIADHLRLSNTLDFDLIEEITPGYFMIHDLDRKLLVMQPCWFYLIKGNWFRYLPNQSGGDQIGLE